MSYRIPLSKKTRWRILARDGFACRYCGRRPPAVCLEVDHVEAVIAGGSNEDGNLVTACEDCNAGKGGSPMGPFVPDQRRQASIGLTLGFVLADRPEVTMCELRMIWTRCLQHDDPSDILDVLCAEDDWETACNAVEAMRP